MLLKYLSKIWNIQLESSKAVLIVTEQQASKQARYVLHKHR